MHRERNDVRLGQTDTAALMLFDVKLPALFDRIDGLRHRRDLIWRERIPDECEPVLVVLVDTAAA